MLRNKMLQYDILQIYIIFLMVIPLLSYFLRTSCGPFASSNAVYNMFKNAVIFGCFDVIRAFSLLFLLSVVSE